ncbi:accessory factor UbiK family protein [Moraxella sp. ZY210820]|uniref:accessory factor UbiK family protein n=1 Tax=unclassified Moraxella TaxID=2685852 RepID=UPI00273170C5|nr:accessory factor UbiK family protein [Moraxella sp. ZY210820]WLF83975.1 accessory factor UbiK family protein [Moraxella sp. ZY210820]
MIEPLVQRILQQFEQPKKDFEHNVRALLSESIEKMDIVSKEELQRHQQALALANQRLANLQQQFEQLQQQLAEKNQ